ncbi:MAG: export ABC transporter ATP-binding protein [Chloroflexi bacterium 13_1_40CM_4_68_4]|nr:MAG: export ABC transporter ATP-binding protein [Chloroflexi bacterium 13_1_40CM_4_68_4]
MNDLLLDASGLRKRYGDRVAVDGVAFHVRAGEVYGLLGPNGAGKTTTISMVCGLLTRDAGDVHVNGRSMNGDAMAAKELIGYVPQEVALYPDLSALENLRFWGQLYGLGGDRLAARVDTVLAVVGLRDRARDKVAAYSGGMKRRLNIAVALLHEPRLLVLDEPTVGVDPQTRHAIFESVEALKRDGLGVLYTTHYMEEAERLCDRIGIIDQGKLIAEGTRRELVASIADRDRVLMGVAGGREELVAAVAIANGIDSARAVEAGVEILCRDGRSLLPRLVETAVRSGAQITSVEVIEPDLETVFLHLTGKALRE